MFPEKRLARQPSALWDSHNYNQKQFQVLLMVEDPQKGSHQALAVKGIPCAAGSQNQAVAAARTRFLAVTIRANVLLRPRKHCQHSQLRVITVKLE